MYILQEILKDFKTTGFNNSKFRLTLRQIGSGGPTIIGDKAVHTMKLEHFKRWVHTRWNRL